MFCLHVEAQVVRQRLSVQYAFPGAYSKNFLDLFSATTNLACLANLKVGAFAVYGERRFMLSDLAGYSAIMAVPTASGTFGFQADYFGSRLFNESQLGFAYARKINAVLDLGAKFNYHAVKVAGYNHLSVANFELGTIFHLTEKLHSGIHVYNPVSSSLGKSGMEKLGSVYSFGMGYEASEKVFIVTEIVKRENVPVTINAGLQYNLHQKLFIRCGLSSALQTTYASVGLNVGFARVDISASYHHQLGFTPGILLLIHLKKPPEE